MEGKVNPREHDISYLEIYNIETDEYRVVKRFEYVIEAPNWTKDGKALVYNSKGRIWRYDLETDVEEEIFTGDIKGCNNDHVLSPDGTQIAISSNTSDDIASKIYVLPLEGGIPKLITPIGPSFLHGWSVDGQTLAYCAYRPEGRNISTISVAGGEELKLTEGEFLNDGPEYAPNGKHIWFNSVRTGLMQAWRMNVDGSEQTQMTFDLDRNTWFPHVSPDGEKIVMIAYKEGDVNPSDHPIHKDVELRFMSAEGGDIKVLRSFFGGQGTINVNSWSPCSKSFAYVRYEIPQL
ncbi:MAG: hypothetical protein R3Y47_08920 [Lachnospiraceae bacterium]